MRRVLPGVLVTLIVIPSTALVAHADTASTSGRSATAVALVERPSRPPRQVATVVIPRLRLRAPLFVGITDDIFDIGLGQWPGTPKPGRPGNLVIGGHRTGARMPFLNIHRMVKGDPIRVVVGKKTFTYRVTSKKIIKPNDMSILKQTRDATLTLYSCHPPHSIKFRYVVRAVLST